MNSLNLSLQRIRKQGELLADPETKASVLLTIMFDGFGNTDFFSWEAETVREEAKRLWKTDLPQVNWDKLFAALTVLTTDAFQRDVNAFIQVCNSFTGSGADFNQYDPADVEEIARTIAEVSILSPQSVRDFSDDVKTYITTQLSEEGFTHPPPILQEYAPSETNADYIEENLGLDGIDVKAYWDSQESKKEDINNLIRNDYKLILTQVSELPLLHGLGGSIEDLAGRLSKALKGQGATTTRPQA